MSQRGFTLLEVLLALAIFSMVALATSHQINLIRNTKETALGQIEQVDALRSALALIRSDLSQAFHVLYADLGSFLQNSVLRGDSVPHTLFDGRKNQLIFTSLSHRTYYAGSRDGEQTEISYFMGAQKGSDRSNLMKRESPLIDGNLFEGGKVY
ncbi:MAG: prepilin-type N-terminal cleavage/methylation domain-containing protein, partial [Proteobacteria bacterium]|nr:prepilin-type N-terminal cleavage/methylation domain-containing protein [Pseudomonadota bacterium]